jgi:hypothetical protein
MSLKERIDAQREGYDSPLQLVPEGQAFPGAAEAGRVSRDLACMHYPALTLAPTCGANRAS